MAADRKRRARRVQILRVVDGDSVEVQYAGLFTFRRRPFAVRLYGIDAPELAQPYGDEARRELESLVRRGGIRMEEIATDRYGRCVGLLYRRRKGRRQSINRDMVRSGMAYWYRQYGGRDLGFPEAEADAKSKRRGVWRERGGAQRPWDYRADQRRGGGGQRRRGMSRMRRWVFVGLLVVGLAAAILVARWLGGQ